jgi:Xaa-Pro aminopeptidase
MLSSAGCRDRVRRLVSWCRDRHVDLAVISNEKEVHYFSGFLRKPFGWLTTRHAIWGCFADGTTFLVCSESEKKNAKGVIADHLIPYRDYSIDETTQTFLEHALRALREHLSRGSHGVKRIALEERYAQVALRQTCTRDRFSPTSPTPCWACVNARTRTRWSCCDGRPG